MNAAFTNIGITRIGQISINVHDLDRAIAFYRDKLGLPLLFTGGKLAFFDCGGVRLMLSPPEKPELRLIVPVTLITHVRALLCTIVCHS